MAPCSDLANYIATCQAKGKAVTLSLGGGSLPPWEMITLHSDQEAKDFGNMMYNTFLGGSVGHPKRPFGSAILDGWVPVLILMQRPCWGAADCLVDST